MDKYFTEFVVPKSGKRATHLWDGEDTLCRMFSTGGLRKIDRYRFTIDLKRGSHSRFCAMCQSRYEGMTCPSTRLHDSPLVRS